MRWDVEFAKNGEYKNKRGKCQTNLLLVNLYKDFIRESALTPFVGFGIGLSQTKTSFVFNTSSRSGSGSLVADNDTAIGFLGHLSAGARYALSDRFALEFSARVLYGRNYSLGVSGYGSAKNEAHHYELLSAAIEAQMAARFSF
jgi:opacity protein-like surface antigen